MTNSTKKNGKIVNKKSKIKSKKHLESNKSRKKKVIKTDDMEEVSDESLLGSLVSTVGSYFHKLF